MLDIQDLDRVLNEFDTDEQQVRRDHAISHVLDALQKIKSPMVFFGGTALARTFLPNGRLSEDIDLFTAKRESLCEEIDGIPTLIQREFPNAFWESLPSNAFDAQDLLLHCDDSIRVKMQIVESETRGWSAVPVTLTSIHQRYADVNPTSLVVPTFDGFVAMKALAWVDRGAVRDIFDLEGLARIHEVTEEARVVIDRIRGYRLSKGMLNQRAIGKWTEELAHQTKLEVTEEECLKRVLDWWDA